MGKQWRRGIGNDFSIYQEDGSKVAEFVSGNFGTLIVEAINNHHRVAELEQRVDVLKSMTETLARDAENYKQRAERAEQADARNPLIGYGYYTPGGKLSHGDGGPLYKMDALNSQLIQAEGRNRELTAALEQIERLHPADEGKSYDIARAALAANAEAAAAPLPPGHNGWPSTRQDV